MVVEVTCTHKVTNHDTAAYVRGYLAKRRNDTIEDVVHLDGGGLRYTVPVDVPAWVTKMLSLPPLNFVEDVTWGSGDCVHIHAACVGTDVRVHTKLSSKDGGTVVDTVVKVDPVYKGMRVPQFLVRTVVEHLFRKERGRDLEYIEAQCAPTH